MNQVVVIFKYTCIGINIITFVVTSIVFIVSEVFIFNVSKVKINLNFENKVQNEVKAVIQTTNNNIIPENWSLKIPKINLDAKIVEGTTDEILNKYIGHFSETQVLNGNIALAAHNRGYDVNYFSGLKDLNVGDEVFYTYSDKTFKYIVSKKDIIKDTDLYVLENTKDNILTLITCVENMPELRRCIICTKN